MATLSQVLADEVSALGVETVADPFTDMHEGDVLRHATEDQPLPLAIAENKGAPWIALYNTRTGERLTINSQHLVAALKKAHDDPAYPEWIGKPVFSKKPTVPWSRGAFTCLLHPSRPERAKYDLQGMPACPAAHLASEEQVRLHMEKKHKSEWKAILGARDEAERQEDRRFQRQLYQSLAKVSQGGEAPAAPPMVKEVVKEMATTALAQSRRGRQALVQQTCLVCGEVLAAQGAHRLSLKIAAHARNQHSAQPVGAT